MRQRLKRNLGWCGVVVLVVGLILLAVGCKGAEGQIGPAGPAGTSKGSVAGKVTNSLTGKSVAGVALTTDPTIKGVSVTTDANGGYTAELPIGTYKITYKKAGFGDATATVTLVAGEKVTSDVSLKPAKAVSVTFDKIPEAKPGDTLPVKVKVDALDDSTVSGYEWTQVSGVKATIDNPTSDSIKVTLPDAAAYKAELVKGVENPGRFGVLSVIPHALVAAETTAFKVTVTTSSGKYTATASVVAHLPYEHSGGIENVSQGVPVVMQSKSQSGYSWSLAGPSGSKASLDSASDPNPQFTPDVSGKYVVTEKNSNTTIDVYAGTWAGAISGIDSKGQPLSAECTACHNGKIAADKFTDWKASGHAVILADNLNTSTHYGESCFSCHSVGFNKGVANGGFDDAADYSAFLKSGMINKPSPNNWANMVKDFPKSAKLANIQCENCHGPNNTPLHGNGTIDAARVSISSDACGSCHGEPPRHGRFQQWEESGHGNFELAIEESAVENRGGTAGHCGRCHSGQGFLAWSQQGDLTQRIQGANGNATVDELKALGLTKDTVQPITCTTCHDPHNPGTVSGDANNATVRISGDTSMLPAGFKAVEVGSGALCMTCHNTRNGLHNDSRPPTNYSAPHTAAQADVLMGENAYFVVPSQRSPHAALENTCVTCHMQETQPPAEFSYNRGGTNHSFKASTEVCSSCHSDKLNGKAFMAGFEARTHLLGEAMSDALLNKFETNVTIKDYTPHEFGGKSYDVKSDTLVIEKANIASVEPTEPHGQQGFLFKFKTPVTFTYKPSGEAAHTMTVSEAQVQLGDITSDGTTALVPVTDPLVKAGWNYFLIHGDASEGIHNPAFINQVLEASINALK